MIARERIAGALAARDPGHARLTLAAAVATGTLLSALCGHLTITALHADPALLAMAIFLSVQVGSMVKDASAPARLITTAWLLPTVVAAISVAVVLSTWRPVVLGIFVLVCGVATWMRRFGARASAIGAVGFMGYFFALFLRPSTDALPAFCLVAAGAVGAQLLMRAVLLFHRPGRELTVLLRELRAASAQAVRLSASAARARTVRGALARLDDVAGAITAWQHRFPTAEFASVDEAELAARTLDARVDTDEASGALVRGGAVHGSADSYGRVCEQLATVLDERATPERVRAAAVVAEGLADDGSLDTGSRLLARCAVSHARLRAVEVRRRHGVQVPRRTEHGRPGAGQGRFGAQLERADAGQGARGPRRSGGRPGDWRTWHPYTRMAVQVMIAATVASVVGEAISASRWYWAVMTAFFVFVGATTRSSILTRAYRRVAGTAAGVVVGIAVVALAGSDTAVLVAICVLAVFGMLYLGPVNYLYSALFLTTMLVALYRMLGVLKGDLLELRLAETVCGALIGVLCAYLVLSVSSRSALVAKTDAFLDAIDGLLTAVTAKLRAPGAVGDGADPFAPAGVAEVRPAPGLVSGPALTSALAAVEAARKDLDATVSAMSAALILGSSRPELQAVRLVDAAARAAARLVQAVPVREFGSGAGSNVGSGVGLDVGSDVAGAVDDVRRAAERARRSLRPSSDGTASPATDGMVATAPHAVDIVIALGRIAASLDGFAELCEPIPVRRRSPGRHRTSTA